MLIPKPLYNSIKLYTPPSPHLTDQFYTLLQKDCIITEDILCTILICLIIQLCIYICFNDVQ